METTCAATVARRLDAALSTVEPVQLALRPPPARSTLSVDGLPASVRDVTVETASAAEFDALLGGAA